VLLAASGAVFAMLLHSLTDFNLQILSNAMLFCILVGLALAVGRRGGKVEDAGAG
jgi:hypothetical protein